MARYKAYSEYANSILHDTKELHKANTSRAEHIRTGTIHPEFSESAWIGISNTYNNNKVYENDIIGWLFVVFFLGSLIYLYEIGISIYENGVFLGLELFVEYIKDSPKLGLLYLFSAVFFLGCFLYEIRISGKMEQDIAEINRCILSIHQSDNLKPETPIKAPPQEYFNVPPQE